MGTCAKETIIPPEHAIKVDRGSSLRVTALSGGARRSIQRQGAENATPAARFLAEHPDTRCGARDTRSTPQPAYLGNWCRKRSTWPPRTGRSRTNSAAERLQEPSRMIRSVAFKATRSISVSVQIPVAVDPLALGEVADAFAAALFANDADELLKGPAFHVTEPLAGVGDQLIDGRKLTAATGPAGGQARREENCRSGNDECGVTGLRLNRPVFNGQARHAGKVVIDAHHSAVAESESNCGDLDIDLLHGPSQTPQFGEEAAEVGGGIVGVRPEIKRDKARRRRSRLRSREMLPSTPAHNSPRTGTQMPTRFPRWRSASARSKTPWRRFTKSWAGPLSRRKRLMEWALPPSAAGLLRYCNGASHSENERRRQPRPA